MRRLIRMLALCTLIGSAPVLATGCYGSFAVTKKLHTWNGGFNKWVSALLFWGLIIIPAYELVMLGDALIFNLIEFWTGSNPIGGGGGKTSKLERTPDGAVKTKVGGVEYKLRPTSGGKAVLERDGKPVAQATVGRDGALVLQDMDGRELKRLSAVDTASMRQRVAAAGLLDGADVRRGPARVANK